MSRNLPPPFTLIECLAPLAIKPADPTTLPFAPSDCTAGVENELQAAVAGGASEVDLPIIIAESGYFADVGRRARSGDASPLLGRHLDAYLNDNPEQIWENSWVRFPFERLGCHARNVLLQDLQADKKNPAGTPRADSKRFFLVRGGECWLRLPVSYLLKIALADAVDHDRVLCPLVRRTGRRLLEHFLSDNTSPETFSFHVCSGGGDLSLGQKVARETARRFLLGHLLILYANRHFGLEEQGQKAMIFCSPLPPGRQRMLNEGISDSFYRELFMSPCLSGWDQGENKHRYMSLCHQVLSRSQLNAVLKLREAGIIVNNLVVLPHISNTSLANNGTHISLGSRILTGASAAEREGGAAFSGAPPFFGPVREKYLGDLAAKIFEHFLPLFVGTYSAAPHRLAFEDFHPERVLGFLPHELDYSHLRMLWRRWRKKADNRILGQSLTPFGPQRLDNLVGRLLGLRGDFVPDFRLLDYPVAWLATDRHCAQDGTLGNDGRLKADLEALGIFDRQMSLYQFYKLREYKQMGFSGFEARFFSLFCGITRDLAPAVELQKLLSCLAFKYMAAGHCTHADIPGAPLVESERRQIVFAAAIGLPTFFVRRGTPNRFLNELLGQTDGVRVSRRYPAYLRVPVQAYCLALLARLRSERELVEMFKAEELLDDLEGRLREPQRDGAAGRLTAGIMQDAGFPHRHPGDLPAGEFNRAAEHYYRGELRNAHLNEGWEFLLEDLTLLQEEGGLPSKTGAEISDPGLRQRLLADDLSPEESRRLIHLLLLAEERDARLNGEGG